MTWKITGDGPVYLRLIGIIRRNILSGAYQPGQRIPSVRDLAAEAQVNPNTMQRALTELEREGILVSQGTMGRLVTDDRAVLEQIRNRELSLLAQECMDKFKGLGLNPQQAGALLQRLGEREEGNE